MSTEELLKPRYKVIADWPARQFMVGAILHLDEPIPDGRIRVWIEHEKQKERYLWNPEENNHFDDYPHLFQKLEWWQERKPEEMPEYVKYSRGVYKVKNWHYSPGGEILFDILNWKNEKGWSSQGGNYWMRHVGLLPATLEEYNQYQSIKHL